MCCIDIGNGRMLLTSIDHLSCTGLSFSCDTNTTDDNCHHNGNQNNDTDDNTNDGTDISRNTTQYPIISSQNWMYLKYRQLCMYWLLQLRSTSLKSEGIIYNREYRQIQCNKFVNNLVLYYVTGLKWIKLVARTDLNITEDQCGITNLLTNYTKYIHNSFVYNVSCPVSHLVKTCIFYNHKYYALMLHTIREEI